MSFTYVLYLFIFHHDFLEFHLVRDEKSILISEEALAFLSSSFVNYFYSSSLRLLLRASEIESGAKLFVRKLN